MSKINEKNEETKYEYGCLMLQLNIPNLVESAENIIKSDDIYNDENNSYGLEIDPHVTILYGLHKDIDDNKIIKLCKLLKAPKLKLKTISLFENEYDVLKFDVESDDLILYNELVKNTFEYTSNYPDYHAHVTIAYLNKGKGKDYLDNKELNNFLTENIEITNFYYSKANGEKYYIDVITGLITKTKPDTDSKEFIFLSEEDLLNYKHINNVNDIKKIETEETELEDENIEPIEESLNINNTIFDNIVNDYNINKKIKLNLLNECLINENMITTDIKNNKNYIIAFKNKNNSINSFNEIFNIYDNIYLCTSNGFVEKYFEDKINVMDVIEYMRLSNF